MSNSSTFGADILHNAALKAESETGKLMLADKHAAEFVNINARIEAGDKIRAAMLASFAATPIGEEFMLAFDDLKDSGTDRNTAQEARFTTMKAQLNAINTTMTRTYDTWRGIKALEACGRTVKVKKVNRITGTAYVCYVTYDSDKLSPELRQLEKDEPTPFNATQLQRVFAVKAHIADNMTSLQVRKLSATKKQGAPNAENTANGTVEPSKVKDQVTAVDTAISTLLKDDGHTIAGGKGVNDALAMLYAKLERTLTDKVKAKALAAYDAEAAPAEAEAA